MNIEDDYVYKEKIKNLLELLSSKTKVEILQGKLFLNDQVISDKSKSTAIVAEIAYLLNIKILNGISKKRKLCKVEGGKRSYSIELLWVDVVTGDLLPQYFNDTAKRKVVNRRDIGSSKNGLLYRTFVNLTGETPKASRIPITKMLNLFIHAETKRFGCNGDEKIINKSQKNAYIHFEDIIKNIPKEYQRNTPFSTLPMHAKRTKPTQTVQEDCTQNLHSNDPLDAISQEIEANLNAYNLNTLKEQCAKGKSDTDNVLRYTYDTEAEIL